MRRAAFVALLGAFGCGEDVAYCDFKELPQTEFSENALTEYLKDNPEVADSIRWVSDDYPHGCIASYDQKFVAYLSWYMDELRRGQPPLHEVPNGIADDTGSHGFYKQGVVYKEEDVFLMWVDHIATSLHNELGSRFPWKLAQLEPDELALILDASNWIRYLGLGQYVFRVSKGGGRVGITDWSGYAAYQFLETNHLIGQTEEETVRALTEWMRSRLIHESGIPTRELYEARCRYRGFPPLACLLQEFNSTEAYGEGYNYTDIHGDFRNPIAGCHATVSLFATLLHSINIPVRRGRWDLENGWHSRPEFPTIGLALTHGDDVYNRLFLRGVFGNVPTTAMFWGIEEVDDFVTHAESDRGWDMFTEGRWNIYRTHTPPGFTYGVDTLLFGRSRELLGEQEEPTIEDVYLIGKMCGESGNELCFPVPIFNENERTYYMNAIDEKIRVIGGGDLLEGAWVISETLH